MELSGEEKRIQALFSELRFHDERIAPRFNLLLNRAMTASFRPNRAFHPGFAWATVLIFAFAALLWWAGARLLRPIASPLVANNPSATKPESRRATPKPSATQQPTPNQRSKVSRVNRAQLLAKRLAARRQAEIVAANQKALQDAQAISKWLSPTATLLSSSSAEVLTSLPQLNEKANQLKSFLPSSN
jgi:hypothetical protein